MSRNEPYQYLALGDSYTIGTAVPFEDNYPNQLVREMRINGYIVADPQIVATDGWTTDELLDAIQKQRPGNHFDFVSLLIGVNNQYRGRSIDNFKEELRELIGQSIRFAGGRPKRVLLLSIPDWGVTPFAEGRDAAKIAGEIDAFNFCIEQMTVEFDCHYIYITDSARRSKNDASLLAPDGLHLSGLEYANWMKKILPLITNELDG